MASVITNLKAASKVVVVALGFIAAWGNDHMDLVPVQYRGYVTGIIAVATLLGAYHAPYAPIVSARKARRKTGTRAKNSGHNQT